MFWLTDLLIDRRDGEGVWFWFGDPLNTWVEWLSYWLTEWMDGWNDWFVGWLSGWMDEMIDLLVDWMARWNDWLIDCLVTEEDIDKEAVFKMAGELKVCGGLPVMLERYLLAFFEWCWILSSFRYVCTSLCDKNVLNLGLCEQWMYLHVELSQQQTFESQERMSTVNMFSWAWNG